MTNPGFFDEDGNVLEPVSASPLADFKSFPTYPDECSSGSNLGIALVKPAPVVVKRPREGVQLCQVYKPSKPPKWNLICFEPKRNGNRCRVEIHDGKVALLSSTGLTHYNVQHIINELESAAAVFPTCNNVMLDGELMHESLDFDTASGMLRNHTEDPRATGFYLHLWDMMPIENFDARYCILTLKERKISLEAFLSYFLAVRGNTHVTKNPYFIGPISKVITYAKNFVIDMGEEGIVLKDMNALYRFSVNGSKANSWLKWKPKFLEDGLIQDMHDGDMTIVDAIEGRGKNKGMTGALKIEGYLCDDGNISPVRDSNSVNGGAYLSSEVGTGLSNAQRKELWQWHLEGTLIGRIVEIKYENITKNNSLHHPVFFRMRPDKD